MVVGRWYVGVPDIASEVSCACACLTWFGIATEKDGERESEVFLLCSWAFTSIGYLIEEITKI